MSKMSHACEDHGQAIFVRCFDGFLVADGATWLDDGLDTGFGDISIVQDDELFCYGMDAVILAAFAAERIRRKKR